MTALGAVSLEAVLTAGLITVIVGTATRGRNVGALSAVAIGGREPYSEDQDEYHATTIYSLLENEIVPMYYSGQEDGFPEEWVKRMKQSLLHVSPQFNSQRMLAEYGSELYEPAHAAYAVSLIFLASVMISTR